VKFLDLFLSPFCKKVTPKTLYKLCDFCFVVEFHMKKLKVFFGSFFYQKKEQKL